MMDRRLEKALYRKPSELPDHPVQAGISLSSFVY
jgi:hypothetical protein